MATIYSIKSAQERNTGGQSDGPVTSAQIILFPGVRYERWADLCEKPATECVGRRRQRDGLEIVD